MQHYPAFRFHQDDPDNNPPRKVRDEAEDEALMASGQWANQPAGNGQAPPAGATPLHPSIPQPVDTGLRFPKFMFHPNGQSVKVASPDHEAALLLESAHWQHTPCDEATVLQFSTGSATPAAKNAPTPAPVPPAPPNENANTLSADQSIALAKKADAETLAELEKAENARPEARKTVLAAIEARFYELASEQTK